MAEPKYPGTGENTPAARAQRETYWRRLAERWKASGLPKSTFCEREGVSDASLHWWLRELDRRDGRGKRVRVKKPSPSIPAARFVPLKVVPSTRPVATILELVVAGQVVRVPPNFDAEALRRLVACLEGRAC